MGRSGLVLLSGVLLGAAAPLAHSIEPHHEYRRLVESSQNLSVLKSDLFGESVNLYNGKTEFLITDIDIPGNNELPVRLARRFNVELRITDAGSGYDDMLGGVGGWSIDVPHITGMFGSTEAWAPARCSANMVPSYNTAFRLTDIWQGNVIHTPAEGARTMLRAEANTPLPDDGVGRMWATAKRDAIDCIPMKSGLPGEGYRVKTARGEIYHFDVAVSRFAGFMYKGRARSNRVRIYLLASRVEDRFGNSVEYQYNANGHPTRISSSDGRQIALTYSGEHLQSAVANGRTWTYAYTSIEGDTRLERVGLPDGSQWKLAYSSALKQSSPQWDGGSTADCAEQPPEVAASLTLSITHPSGAHGRFQLGNARHYRSGVHMSECVKRTTGTAVHYELATPNFFDVMTLVSKEVSGPGLPGSHVWNYAYGGGYQPLWGTSGAPALYPCTNCQEEKPVRVTHPDGTMTEYAYGFQYARNEGRLLGTLTKNAAGNVIRSERTLYMTDEQVKRQSFAPRYGLIYSGDDPSTAQVRPVVQSVVEQDGIRYVNETAARCGQDDFCFDVFAYPTQTAASNSGGYQSGEHVRYSHDTRGWVLGQVATRESTTVAATLEHNEFDHRSLPTARWEYGLLKWRRSYHPNGAIASITAPGGGVTQMSDWKRGVPQQIKFADGSGVSAAVDDNGWVTAVRDQLGALSRYEHDSMGRTVRVLHPEGDDVAWNSVHQAFDQVPHDEYGIGPGHWRVTVSNGSARSISYLDALWRPVLTHEYDATDTEGTQRFKRFAYDVEGRTTFASYPGSGPSLAQGVWSEFDAIGRKTVSAVDSELGLLATTYQYLDGAKLKTVDPRGTQTLTTFWTADKPAQDAPRSIVHPENAYTDIVRDLFGKPLTITRRNGDRTQSLTRSYVYDAHHRLCKSLEPETGATLVSYDAAGNVASTAQGVVADGTDTCSSGLGSERRVKREYDILNRLTKLTFPDGNGDQSWIYAPDGQVKSIGTSSKAGVVSNHYTYNLRGLLAAEQLVHANDETWALRYAYDANASLRSLSYPGGAVIDFAPNALGQPTRAGSLATAVRYHPDGRMASLIYGNGVKGSVDSNLRGLPALLRDRAMHGDVLHDALSYDVVGNMTSIVDGTGGDGTRTMRYDTLDRLVGADSISFAGAGRISYEYDALDNLRAVLNPGGRMHRYGYDASNRLTNVMDQAQATVMGLAYDVQGNMSRKNGEDHVFDYGNRLRSVGEKERYLYDGHGRRTQAVSPTLGTIRSMYSKDGSLVRQTNEREAKSHSYVYLNGRLLASISMPHVAAPPVLKVPGHTTDDAYPVGWTAMKGATSYELQELPTEGDWVQAYRGAGTSIQMAGKDIGHYTYRVRSCNDTGCGSWSETAAIFVRRVATPPYAITVPELGPRGIYTITWLPPRPRAPSETVYELEESTVNDVWIQVYRGEPLVWKAASKPAGKYRYRVRACNPDGCSDYTVGGWIEAFHAPESTTLSGPHESLTGSYSLYWAARDGANRYEVHESVNDGLWVKVADSTALTTTLSGRKTATYSYVVFACNRTLCGAHSDRHTVVSTIAPEYAPEVTYISQHPNSPNFTLLWSGVDTSTHYQVWEQHNGGPFSPLVDVADGRLDRHGLPSGKWSYNVRGCNKAGCGPAGPIASAQVLIPPTTPTITLAYQEMRDRPPTDLKCSVRWSGVAGADRYELYSWPNLNRMYSGDKTSVFSRNTGLYCSEWQVVRACNSAGCSGYSAPVQRHLEIIPGGIIP